MKTGIFTLDRETLEEIGELLPGYVIRRAQEPGYFTLGAIDDHDEIIGITQFYINITEEGAGFAEIVYIYTMDGCRREGIGAKLLDKVNRILKKSGVPVSTVLVPASDRGMIRYETPAKEIDAFFEDCSYIASKDSIKSFKTVLEDIFQGLNDRNVKRYTRLAGRE